MAVRIRLARIGRKKRPFFRVVAAEHSMPRDGRYIEVLGTYDPLPDPSKWTLREERVLHWLQVGARPSETVNRILRRRGILDRFDEMRRTPPAAQKE